MSNPNLRSTRRGDERLIQTCLIVDRLCVDRLPAIVRLEAQLGRTVAQNVITLARYGTTETRALVAA